MKHGGHRVLVGPLQNQPNGSIDAAVPTQCTGGLHIRSAPSHDRTTETAMLLLPTQKVAVQLDVQLDGTRWLKVTRAAGNMEGWVPREMMDLDGELGYGSGGESPVRS